MRRWCWRSETDQMDIIINSSLDHTKVHNIIRKTRNMLNKGTNKFYSKTRMKLKNLGILDGNENGEREKMEMR